MKHETIPQNIIFFYMIHVYNLKLNNKEIIIKINHATVKQELPRHLYICNSKALIEHTKYARQCCIDTNIDIISNKSGRRLLNQL